MRSTISIIACLAALAAAGDGAAQTSVYRWVDKNGNVHFSDTPPQEDATEVTRRRVGGGQADESQLPYATQIAMKRSPVTLFSSSGCGEPCASGRKLLQGRGIPYAERNAEATPADADALKKLVGVLEVPVQIGRASCRERV